MLLLAGSATAGEEPVVNVYNWADYMGPTTLADFESETGIEVNYDTYASSEIVEAKLLVGMDEYLEEAAMDLGGRPVRVLLDITLPIISPAIVAGWLLAFTLSLDDLVIASFVSGPGATTLPMLIFSKVRLGVTPDVNALASLIILAVTCGVVVAGAILRRQHRQRARDEHIRETA